MNPKTVLIIKHFNPMKGGGERYSVNLAKIFKKKGLSFDVITSSVTPELQKEFSVRILDIPEQTLSRSYAFNQACQPLLQNGEYSCILGLTQVAGCHIYRVGGGLLKFWENLKYPGLLGKIQKQFSMNHQFSLRLEDYVFQHVSLKKIIVHSELLENQIKKFYPEVAQKMVLIPNGIDSVEFTPKNWTPKQKQEYLRLHGVKPGKLNLLFAGNNYTRKGLFIILEVLSALSHLEGIHLWIAGKGDEEEVRLFAKKTKCRCHLSFLGLVQKMNELYNAMDLLVHPALYDPCSNSCMEALACGLPVITTDLNGASMFLKNGGGVVLHHQNIHPQLKEILETFYHSPVKIYEEKEKAVKAVKDLTLEGNAEKVYEIIKELN